MSARKPMQKHVPVLKRQAMTTARISEFFTERELSQQIGFQRADWPIALLKELVDNGLDACDQLASRPEINVSLWQDGFSVGDNGPGLSEATIDAAADYALRVSDKAHYVSPTRGQLGNALKCVFAAPYVACGNGHVIVEAHGKRHSIVTTFDAVAQEPRVQRTATSCATGQGTKIGVEWQGVGAELASCEDGARTRVFSDAASLVRSFAVFSPHARFALQVDGRSSIVIDAARATEKRWLPTDPTSAHWYDPDAFRGLLAARLRAERTGGSERLTLRSFVGEFRGLSSDTRRKEVLDACGLGGHLLSDLIDGNKLDGRADGVLREMQARSRPVHPDMLGRLGEASVRGVLAQLFGVDAATFRYKRVSGVREFGQRSLPFVVEVAFARLRDPGAGRTLLCGVNFTPSLRSFHGLDAILGGQRLDTYDPVIAFVHLVSPIVPVADRGKSVVDLRSDFQLMEALKRAVEDVTRDWQRAKKTADRAGRMRRRDLERLERQRAPRVVSLKEAVYEAMPQAYALVSDNGALPANARQLMYAARPLVLERTGGRTWSGDAYFTQTLLPDYLDDPDTKTAGWDIVYDDRGHFAEPHTDMRIGLGTLSARRYIQGWTDDRAAPGRPGFVYRAPTSGPAQRFRSVLFIEKEGFQPLFERAQLAQRFDLALMSTKGMSVTAARQLVEQLSVAGCTIFVLHDFDKSGLSILATLTTDTRRYRFETKPRIVDLGLRLADVRQLGLQAEPVAYGKSDPRPNLLGNGATPEECAFLCSGEGRDFGGQRVELNALTSPQLLAWLEAKLVAHGAGKFVPDTSTLEGAYRDAARAYATEESAARAHEGFDVTRVDVPTDLSARVRAWLQSHEEAPWDQAIAELIRGPQ